MQNRLHCSIITFILLLGLNSTRAVEQRPAFAPWRCGENGGINVLYCYLLAERLPCAYTELLSEQTGEVGSGPYTAVTLSRLAARHGMRLQPTSLNLHQLASCRMPVIVHMDGESPDIGAFLLVTSISSDSVTYVNGPSVTVHDMSPENFQRVWSGVALLPAPTHRTQFVLAGAAFCAGFGLMTGFSRKRLKPL